MKALVLSTVSEFFRKRAGLFLVLIGILFGFLRGEEHHAFAVFFLTASFGKLYLFLIWLFYALFCMQSLLQQLQQPEYGFIYLTRLWPVPVRIYRFTVIAFGLLQPVLYYGVYLIVIAVQDKILPSIWPVLLFYPALALLVAVSLEWKIRQPAAFIKRKSNSIVKLPFKRPVSLTYWKLEWLLKEKGITLLIGKAGSVLVTFGTLLYFSTGDYDLRLPAIGMSFAYLLNTGISYEIYQWESEIWMWGRTLPASVFMQIRQIVKIHAMIILPETLILLRDGLLTFYQIVQLYMLGLSLIFLLHLFFYKKEGIPEDSAKTVFLGFILLTLLILYKIPVLMMAGMLFLFSILVYPKWRKIH
ncbi:hypothetical protein [Dyadobacter sediminis]|uniref:Uncharacterized protein n=1 Tax=Dyadobacter sediminis TaxID=1493691 RepID=A0A5R9KEU3_9BACT|nr:hypothetical protein [Dyadobacter sediminis]TLU94629.1 hypothetical protein FEM55_10390 [Dyadobacter sediminis]GGB89596.1 hypothetical protein GCM10011325_16310 [Dyadobacter sediminis]